MCPLHDCAATLDERQLKSSQLSIRRVQQYYAYLKSYDFVKMFKRNFTSQVTWRRFVSSQVNVTGGNALGNNHQVKSKEIAKMYDDIPIIGKY